MLGEQAEADAFQLHLKQQEANQIILQKAVEENKVRYVCHQLY